ncbi:MAG: M23 family metallopeptidase [Chloroflexi bacterium]|nr:M23 family metallopeptidase [Chloroflexota bacterium]
MIPPMNEPPTPQHPRATPGQFLADLASSLGLQQYAVHAILLIVAAGVIWLGRANVMSWLPAGVDVSELAAIGEAVPTPTPVVASLGGTQFPVIAIGASASEELTRQTDIHTNIPTRPRTDIQSYTVQTGDTLFGIAEKFGLAPETIVWGNPVLKDDPHLLRPGQELRIPPTNGVLRDVQPGDRLDVLARYYQVTVEDIVNWPGNDLDPDNPELVVGKVLMVPGGKREFVQFVIPTISKVKRNVLPKDAGPGQCPGGYTGGSVGSGFFAWPATNHWLSGNNYWAGHLGIDIAAGTGDAIFASDSGVAVFAGWSNWGYGNMVVLDHGNGWQTLYAHLSQWNVSCGQSVFQGNLIGLAGSTGNSSGPHLHFEMNYQGTRPNPWGYLPAP